jgi:hypothetical protein
MHAYSAKPEHRAKKSWHFDINNKAALDKYKPETKSPFRPFTSAIDADKT